MDNLDSIARFRVMSANRSTGVRSTERRLRALLARYGIRGWKLGHRSGLPGRPDIVFPRAHVAAFVDGCFWHGCRKCRSIPERNRVFWMNKIEGTRRRDRAAGRRLRYMGWTVIRVWEHDLRLKPSAVVQRLRVLAE
jgi:DNA mismatch endonuclease (patch repair protein)